MKLLFFFFFFLCLLAMANGGGIFLGKAPTPISTPPKKETGAEEIQKRKKQQQEEEAARLKKQREEEEEDLLLHEVATMHQPTSWIWSMAVARIPSGMVEKTHSVTHAISVMTDPLSLSALWSEYVPWRRARELALILGSLALSYCLWQVWGVLQLWRLGKVKRA